MSHNTDAASLDAYPREPNPRGPHAQASPDHSDAPARARDRSVHIATTASEAVLTSRGALRRMDVGGLSMLQYPASEVQPGLANVYLRIGEAGRRRAHSLLGSAESVLADAGGVTLRGHVGGFVWALRLVLHHDETAWCWQVAVRNETGSAATVDFVVAHDIALAPYDIVRINEFYVSQYLDVTAVPTTGHGTAVAVRQNMPGPVAPWVVLACGGGGNGWATDALQLRALDGGEARLDFAEDLPNRRLQHEHTLMSLGSRPLTIAPGEVSGERFASLLVADHPDATGSEDEQRAAAALDLFAAIPDLDITEPRTVGCYGPPISGPDSARATVFDVPALSVDPCDDAFLSAMAPGRAALLERGPGGALFAAVVDGVHAATAAKERAVLRPHGQILRTGAALTPETGVLTSTVWMAGGFASQVTRGHVGRTKLLSGRRTYLGLQPASGLRLFVNVGEGWRRLDIPTVWLLRPDGARWVYAAGPTVFEVLADAPTERHELPVRLRVLHGQVEAVLAAWHVALAGDDGQQVADLVIEGMGDQLRVRAEVQPQAGALELHVVPEPVEVGDDGMLHGDRESRGEPWLVTRHAEVRAGDQVSWVLRSPAPAGFAEVTASAHLRDPWRIVDEHLDVSAPGPLSLEVETLNALVPWCVHDAWVHYLSPRGLEQFSGGGWGTRDVCQGPVGLLTALGRFDALRTVVVTVMRAQNDRGDWPQAFEFLPPAGRGQGESHGDVVYWPLLALGEYLQATGDATVLRELAPATGDRGPTGPFPVVEHVERALRRILDDTRDGVLPRYGHGDWNDSLQPAQPDLSAGLVSTWTAILQAHSLSQLAAGLRTVAGYEDLASRCEVLAKATATRVRDELTADGVLSGYALFTPGTDPELLVHPRDQRTGLTYGILPWIHAVSGQVLSPKAAAHHLELAQRHLVAPDGARLFDRPAAYRGGPMKVFQRAEAATFWGREIGLMYTHAHLRWCEALAVHGDAARLFEALQLANPIGLTGRVPAARPRQTSCYYSSSDAAFADRYSAAEGYSRVMDGGVPLEGGWRVYSSGPGLFLRLMVERWLGLRVRCDRVEIDPVLDPRLDGLVASVPLGDSCLQLAYHVAGAGSGVSEVRAGDTMLATDPLENRYRRPGVSVALSDLRAVSARGTRVSVHVGS